MLVEEHAHHGGQPYAITLVEPTHSIYALSLTTGFMYPAYSPNTSSSVLGLGFSSDIRTSLSAGPIKIDEHRFLVAGHVAKGGWADAYRLTFFYVFSAKPPFAIKCVTPVMSFGLSERARASKEYALEYNTHSHRASWPPCLPEHRRGQLLHAPPKIAAGQDPSALLRPAPETQSSPTTPIEGSLRLGALVRSNIRRTRGYRGVRAAVKQWASGFSRLV